MLPTLAACTRPLTGVFTPTGLLVLGVAITLHTTPQQWKHKLSAAFSSADPWTLGLIVLLVGGVLSLFAGMAAPFFYFPF